MGSGHMVRVMLGQDQNRCQISEQVLQGDNLRQFCRGRYVDHGNAKVASRLVKPLLERFATAA